MRRATKMRSEKPQRRSSTNLSAHPELVREAKELGLNLSHIFESALQDAIRAERRRRWTEENRKAIESYNARVAERGVFSDGWRKF